MDNRRRAILTNNSFMFLYGLSAVLIGPALPGILRTYDLSLSTGGLLSALQNAGGIAGAAIAILIADRVRRPLGVVVAFALLGVTWIMIGVRQPFSAIVVWFVASGLLIRVLDVFLNAHTGVVAGTRSGRSMNVLHMFFSVGAFAGPILARLVMGNGVSWQWVFSGTGLVYLVVVLAAAFQLPGYIATGTRPSRSAPRRQRPGADHMTPATRDTQGVSGAALLAAALFFYSIHQVGVSTWIPYHLETTGRASSDLAGIALSVYWLGIIVGRFAASRVVERTGHRLLLPAGAALSGIATLGGVLIPTAGIAITLLFVAGLGSGATIPLAYSMGYELLPGRTGALTAAMSLVMLGGRFLGPWIVGIVADRTTLSIAMTIPAATLLFTAVLALMVADRRAIRDA